MVSLTALQLHQACRIFFDLAYPGGEETIPLRSRRYLEICTNQPIEDFLPPAEFANEIAQELLDDGGEVRGYALRLGSHVFPHLKLQLLLVNQQGLDTWVFTVDTHDRFSTNQAQPPGNHPDADKWLALQRHNQALKEKIEDAWSNAGFTTFMGLLSRDFTPSMA